MATYKGESGVWDYTPTSAATAGDVVLLGDNDDILGVVVADTEASQLGAIRTNGIFEFTTAVSDFSQGDACYYDSVNNVITEDVTDTYAGRVASQPTSTTVRVDINASSMMPEAS